MQSQTTASTKLACTIVDSDGSISVPFDDCAGDKDASSNQANADAEPPEPGSAPLPNTPQHSDLSVNIILGVDEPPAHLLIDDALMDSLHESVSAVAHHLGIQSGSITVNLIDDHEMIELHDHFCGLKSTTDVLTFDLAESESDWEAQEFAPPASDSAAQTLSQQANLLNRTKIEVDLALCIDEAARQAQARQHSLKAELLLYAIHGILHCLGHDDHDPAKFDAMHQLEDQLLEKIGFSAVFRGRSANANE